MPKSIKKPAFVHDFTLHKVEAQADHVGLRLDVVLHELLPAYSRAVFQKLIKQGQVSIDGRLATKASWAVTQPVHLEVRVPSGDAVVNPEHVSILDTLGVHLIAEYPEFLIINKPAGLVVHKPAHTSNAVTLVDWLLHRYPELAKVGQPGRPGIVHRLDKETSGLMIIARTQGSYETFTAMFKARQIVKVYCAIVEGHPEKKFTVEYAIRRHPTQPTKMAHSRSDGKQAETIFVVREFLDDAAVVIAYPKTGRTHQIRVHCAAVGHPIIGDTVYGHKSPVIARQALHALELMFELEGKKFSFDAQLPDDMAQAIKQLCP